MKCVRTAWLLHNSQKLFHATYELHDVNDLVLATKPSAASSALLVADTIHEPAIVQRF
jgi:hypothetical protein